MDKQRTIQREVILKGIGLHTANKVNIAFKPAEIDAGIIFRRTDLAQIPAIKASLENLLPEYNSLRRTSIGKDGVEVHTIEHLMAALAGLRVDNLYIDVDNNEMPGLDGSSVGFLETLEKAGIKEQEKSRQYYAVKEPVIIEDKAAYILAFPSSEFKISYTLSYDHPLLKAQFLEMDITPELFKKELVSARTFCLQDETSELKQQGLGKGATYDNTVVLGKDGVVKNKLRYDDEFVRHGKTEVINLDLRSPSRRFIRQGAQPERSRIFLL